MFVRADNLPEPWLSDRIDICLNMSYLGKRTNAPRTLRLQFRELVTKYNTLAHVYTDGSAKDENVGFSVVSHAQPVNYSPLASWLQYI